MSHIPQPLFSHGCNILYTMALIFITIKAVTGFPATTRSEYHLCMMNEFSTGDDLTLACNSSVNSGDELVIPNHGSYNWSFHPLPGIMGLRSYYCNAHWGTIQRGGSLHHFQAFIDKPEFVDEKCGGRHCIWKFSEDGLFLYQIKDGVFKFMYR